MQASHAVQQKTAMKSARVVIRNTGAKENVEQPRAQGSKAN
jgi:hypothetical protein